MHYYERQWCRVGSQLLFRSAPQSSRCCSKCPKWRLVVHVFSGFHFVTVAHITAYSSCGAEMCSWFLKSKRDKIPCWWLGRIIWDPLSRAQKHKHMHINTHFHRKALHRGSGAALNTHWCRVVKRTYATCVHSHTQTHTHTHWHTHTHKHTWTNALPKLTR